MRFNAVSSFSIATIFLSFLISLHAFSHSEAVPPDVLELLPKGYVYADYPGVFDDVEGDGLTFETWIYLTTRPKERPNGLVPDGQWLIFAKPGSYYATVSARTLTDGFDRTRPEGTAWAQFGISRRWQHGWSTAFVKHEISFGDFPIARWVHIAYQVAEAPPNTHWTQFFDRQHIAHDRSKGPIGYRESPLLIGGIKHVPFENETRWFGPENFESVKGYIDEFRISKGLRYAKVGNIRPRRRFRADASTIALWHFDEGPFAPRYADSSGNGYTLVAGGSLAGQAVNPRGKLATAWGSLKQGRF